MPQRALASILLFSLSVAASAADHQVVMGGLTFSPSRLEVQVGDTVTWVNTGGTHSVTAEDGSFASGDAASDDSPVWPFTYRFDRPGLFPYFCIPHGLHGMRGVIDVSGPNHPGVPELSRPTLEVSEADGEAVVTVRRARGSTGAIWAVLSTHCTTVTGPTELLLVPPTAAGQARPPAAARISTFGAEGDGQPTDEINWQELLAGTTWRQ